MLKKEKKDFRQLERWKTIKNHQDYAVSNHGRVKRITNGVWPSQAKKGKILKQTTGSHRYYYLNLGRKGGGKLVHALVCKTFKGKRPSPNHVCNHKDGDKKNNRLTNLEWVTKSEDLKHAYNIGLRKRTGKKKIRRKCKCGCGKITTKGKKWITYHNVLLVGMNTRFKKGQKPWNCKKERKQKNRSGIKEFLAQ